VILQSITDFRSFGIMLSSRKKQVLNAPARKISKVLYFKLTHYPIKSPIDKIKDSCIIQITITIINKGNEEN